MVIHGEVRDRVERLRPRDRAPIAAVERQPRTRQRLAVQQPRGKLAPGRWRSDLGKPAAQPALPI